MTQEQQKPSPRPRVDQDREPNFRDKSGKLYLVRCFACDAERGRENWAMMVARGICSWCGWDRNVDDSEQPE